MLLITYVVLLQVSDQHHLSSFTLKSDAKFRLPVVFDFEEEKFVAVVDQLDKRKLCVWTEDLTDYKDWKKKLVGFLILQIFL